MRRYPLRYLIGGSGAEWEALEIGAHERLQQKVMQVIMEVIFCGLERVNSIIAS